MFWARFWARQQKRGAVKQAALNQTSRLQRGRVASGEAIPDAFARPTVPLGDSVVWSCADNGEVNEVVPLADKSCTLTIIQRVVEYLKKHAEFEAQGAEDEVDWPSHAASVHFFTSCSGV